MPGQSTKPPSAAQRPPLALLRRTWFPFHRELIYGVANRCKPRHKAPVIGARPWKLFTFSMQLGAGQSWTTRIFPGSVAIPLPDTTWPRNVTSFRNNWHLLGFTRSLASPSLCNTLANNTLSNHWLKECPLVIMLSRYTRHTSTSRPSNTASISLSTVEGSVAQAKQHYLELEHPPMCTESCLGAVLFRHFYLPMPAS